MNKTDFEINRGHESELITNRFKATLNNDPVMSHASRNALYVSHYGSFNTLNFLRKVRHLWNSSFAGGWRGYSAI